MTDRRSQAESIVRDTFGRKIRQATQERDRALGVLAQCEAETLSASDLELLAADGEGFSVLVGARVGL